MYSSTYDLRIELRCIGYSTECAALTIWYCVLVWLEWSVCAVLRYLNIKWSQLWLLAFFSDFLFILSLFFARLHWIPLFQHPSIHSLLLLSSQEDNTPVYVNIVHFSYGLFINAPFPPPPTLLYLLAGSPVLQLFTNNWSLSFSFN